MTMAKMAGIHAEGVTDLHSYDMGVQDGIEKEKVVTINSLITAITMAELTAPEIADALVEQLILVDPTVGLRIKQTLKENRSERS
jgi:hypothetical protein